MAEQTMCPLCGKHPLKVGTTKDGKKANRIYCEGYKYDPDAGSVGECEFNFFLTDGKKAPFGKDLTTADAKKLFAGETITSPLRHKMTFDKDAPQFNYKKIEWAEKKEDAFL